MASVTRSSRRVDGRNHPYQEESAGSMRSRTTVLQHAPNASTNGGGGGGRTKRVLDASGFEAIKNKKARISVEIISKNKPIPHSNEAATLPTDVVTNGGASNPTMNPPVSTNQTSKPTTTNEQNLTKHQSKVLNGIKHELDRLQSQPVNTKDQGRKLRSQEAARFKSELSAYFPEYDEVMGNEAKEQYLLNVDTPIVIIDSSDRRLPDPRQPHSTGAHFFHHPPQELPETFPVRGYGDALYTDLFDTQRIDFGFLEAYDMNKTLNDPLANGIFEPVHKRAERLERSIRNTEKGRAQHERDQIARLLDSLQSHDWLRVLGVNSIIDSKKREFEPARQHFIRGCQSILDKFRNWSLEEKRRKLEKDRALAELAEEEEEDEEEDEVEDDEEEEEEEGEEEQDDEAVEERSRDDGSRSASNTSEPSSPAKQLHAEAMARSKLSAKAPSKGTRPPPVAKPPPPPKAPSPPKEFKSFFKKKYERDNALHHHRRTGRKVIAWGHPIPEFAESDFMLPDEYRDPETLRIRARQKRRDKRSTRH